MAEKAMTETAELAAYMRELEKKLTNLEIACVGLLLEYRVRLLTIDAPDADCDILARQADRSLRAIEEAHQYRKQKIAERFQS